MSVSELRTIGKSILGPEGVMVLKDVTTLTADTRGRYARIERTAHNEYRKNWARLARFWGGRISGFM